MSDPTAALVVVENWPQALVAIASIGAFIVWPGILAWLNTRKTQFTANQVQAQVNKATDIASDVKRTLTENNGGTHVKDQLDEIQRGLSEMREWRINHTEWAELERLHIASRLEAYEKTSYANGRLLRELSEKLLKKEKKEEET